MKFDLTPSQIRVIRLTLDAGLLAISDEEVADWQGYRDIESAGKRRDELGKDSWTVGRIEMQEDK